MSRTEAFLDRIEYALSAEDLASQSGLAQQLNPRVKLIGFAVFVIAVVWVHRLSTIGALFAVALAIALVSRVPISAQVSRVWIAVLLFTGTIALPALFLTPGQPLYRVPALHWRITSPGLTSAAFLLARAETTATFSLLLVLTTPWTHLLKSLRTLGVPVVLVVILGMTYRYIFVLLRTAHEMLESRRSRLLAKLPRREQRRLAVSSAGVLLDKTLLLSGDVHLAMQARGFRGEVYLLQNFRMAPRDWAALAFIFAVGASALWFGR